MGGSRGLTSLGIICDGGMKGSVNDDFLGGAMSSVDEGHNGGGGLYG